MRLNPPASSSDLDVARAAARRLHDRARRPEDPDEGPAPAPAPPPPPEPPAFRPPDFEPPLSEPEALASSEPVPEPASEPEPTTEPEPASEPVPTPESEPEPLAEEAVPLPEEPGAAPPFEALEPDPSPPAFEPTPEPPASEPEPTGLESPELEAPLDEELPVEPQLEELDLPAGDSSAADAWDPAPDDALSELAAPVEPSLEGLGPPDAPYAPPGEAVSPEDLLGGDPVSEPEPPLDFGAPALGEDEAERAPDDLVASPGPSWDDVADACLALAQSHGAMLVDPSGQVLTARGDWPEPGPDAIAGRLVSMMERTLQEAPTRSVSAPIGGQHLTAWRIPASEGYLTVVFMGDAPLSADERPAIDDHIAQALDS